MTTAKLNLNRPKRKVCSGACFLAAPKTAKRSRNKRFPSLFPHLSI